MIIYGKRVEFSQYDNVTCLGEDCYGRGLYLTVKSGKMGLLHLENDLLKDDYKVVKSFDCVYDYISLQQGSVVCFYRKNREERRVRVYWAEDEFLSEEYESMNLTHGWLLQLENKTTRLLMDIDSGKILSDKKGWRVVNGWLVPFGKVCWEMNGEQSRLLFIRDDNYIAPEDTPGFCACSFSGDCRAIYAPDDIYGVAQAVGFMIISEEKAHIISAQFDLIAEGAHEDFGLSFFIENLNNKSLWRKFKITRRGVEM